jgi:hypothetical protein
MSKLKTSDKKAIAYYQKEHEIKLKLTGNHLDLLVAIVKEEEGCTYQSPSVKERLTEIVGLLLNERKRVTK